MDKVTAMRFFCVLKLELINAHVFLAELALATVQELRMNVRSLLTWNRSLGTLDGGQAPHPCDQSENNKYLVNFFNALGEQTRF